MDEFWKQKHPVKWLRDRFSRHFHWMNEWMNAFLHTAHFIHYNQTLPSPPLPQKNNNKLKSLHISCIQCTSVQTPNILALLLACLLRKAFDLASICLGIELMAQLPKWNVSHSNDVAIIITEPTMWYLVSGRNLHFKFNMNPSRSFYSATYRYWQMNLEDFLTSLTWNTRINFH